jgi:hypothetical protein
LFVLFVINFIGMSLLIIGYAYGIDVDIAAIGVFCLAIFCVISILWLRDGYLLRLACFGTTAGVVELRADVWLISEVTSLSYQPTDLLLWSSPAFMPLSWGGMLLSAALFGQIMTRITTLSNATLATIIGGCACFFVAEALACYSGWWTYREGLALGPVPVFIILGEALVCIPLAWMGVILERKGLFFACAMGLGQGLWILASYRIALLMTGSI